MSRDVTAVIEAILPNPTMTLALVSIPTNHAQGIERGDLITLNIKEPA